MADAMLAWIKFCPWFSFLSTQRVQQNIYK